MNNVLIQFLISEVETKLTFLTNIIGTGPVSADVQAMIASFISSLENSIGSLSGLIPVGKK